MSQSVQLTEKVTSHLFKIRGHPYALFWSQVGKILILSKYS